MMAADLFTLNSSGSFKMRAFFVFMFFAVSLFGGNINEALLKVQATLLPKIYLMDYDFQRKLVGNTITIAIVYKKSDYQNAKKLQTFIKDRYKSGLNSYQIKTTLVNYKDIESAKANIYYLFPNKKEKIRQAVQQAARNHALTFSYRKEDLKHGVMISLSIGKKIKPILNLEAVRMYHISLRPVLINISHIYRNDMSMKIENIYFHKRGYLV